MIFDEVEALLCQDGCVELRAPKVLVLPLSVWNLHSENVIEQGFRTYKCYI